MAFPRPRKHFLRARNPDKRFCIFSERPPKAKRVAVFTIQKLLAHNLGPRNAQVTAGARVYAVYKYLA